jgi:hypothetical protein
MKRAWLVSISISWLFCFCSDPIKPIDRHELFETVAEKMPDYPDFLTVDELHQSLVDLKEEYPELVSLTTLGETDMGNPIYELQIGEGEHHALLFGFPHPNEPIGSMMLHFITRELAENELLRNHFDFTWHIVICAEPDKAKLNEGWFKGDLTLTKYARNYYRPPSYQQVEWTFPVSYKSYSFDDPTPEARALMQIIDNHPISFSFGLHNSGFGGAYYYWSHDVPELYPTLYSYIDKQGIPLHLGEPEVPWGVKFDDKSMFKMTFFTEGYDYMEEHSPIPPEQLMNSGASSDDYIKAKYDALTVNCELPYFYDPRIEDTSPSDMTRREANLEAIELSRQRYLWAKERFDMIQPLLASGSLFVDTIKEFLRTAENDLDTMENAVRTEKEFERQATNAEKWDALSVRKFYNLLGMGQFIRLLEYEKQQVGDEFPEILQEILNESLEAFNKQAAEAEEALDYTVVPIKKLASVQLMTALYAMDHVQEDSNAGVKSR